MGATGESVRRLTDFGHDPTWSPDGKQIVFAIERITSPGIRFNVNSQLWSVNVSTGEKRQITEPQVVPDAVQPNWSPHGQRIAYWGLRGGQRDLWTVWADGRGPVPVTQDAHMDWSPVWSPDGNYLYFSSDRGGSMNLWRVPIEEKSGKVLGTPEPLTTPSAYSGRLSISSNGRRIAYAQTTSTSNIHRIGFDPSAGKAVGQSVPITQGSMQVSTPDLSPDGGRLAFTKLGRQEDIFVVKTDGTELRQLTDDPHRDRGPRWSPDGKRIAFYSTRSGEYEAWAINPDGSALQQLTYESRGSVTELAWSPDGTRLAYRISGIGPFLLEVGKSWKEQSPAALPPLGEPDAWFTVHEWSPDGRKLAGHRTHADTSRRGIVIYSLESQAYQRLTDVGVWPRWLSDSRRLLFLYQGKIHLLDTRSGKVHEALSVAPHAAGRFARSRDDRTLYFALRVTEGDIWLMNLE